MSADQDLWQRIYQEDGTPWDLGGPAPPLTEILESAARWGLEAGAKIAVPGCGLGHDAAALAAAGFQVRAIDPVPAAVEAARMRYGAEVDWAIGDWFEEPQGTYDAVFDHAFFVAFEPGRRSQIVAAHANHLKPGGLWLGLYWHTVRAENGRPWAVQPAEITALAQPSFEVLGLEEARKSHPRRAGREFWMVARKRGTVQSSPR